MTVEAMIGEILKTHPELEFYRAEISAARAGRKVAGRWRNPELTAELGSKRVWDRTGDEAVLGDGLAWSVSLAQPIEFPGRAGLRKAIADRELELAELGLAQFESVLAARARALALETFSAQQRLEAAREVSRRYLSVTEALVQREPAGPAPLLEQRIIEAASVTLTRKVSDLERETQRALLELNQLRGQPAMAPLKLSGKLEPAAHAPALERLLETAHAHNFDLRARQTELEKQGFRVRLAEKERYPEITVAPFYSSEKAADEERIAGVGVSVPLPLWSRGGTGVAVARAREVQAEASFRAAWRELERKIAEHLLALQSKQAEMAAWRPGAADRFREAAETADRHYRLGAVPLTLYLEMQSRYLEALDALLTTQAEALEHHQQLELLVGRPLDQVAGR